MARKKYLYEVRVLVPQSLINAFSEWLKVHINDMTNLPYFLEAETAHGESLDHPHMHLCVVRYTLRTRQDLQVYLEQDAAKMRSQLPSQFQHQIQFSRGVITQIS